MAFMLIHLVLMSFLCGFRKGTVGQDDVCAKFGILTDSSKENNLATAFRTQAFLGLKSIVNVTAIKRNMQDIKTGKESNEHKRNPVE